MDGDNTLAESGAIIEYLVDRYGDGRLAPPAGSPERLRYTYWLHYAEGSLMPLMLMKLVFDRLAHPPMPLVMRPAAALIAMGVKGKFVTPRLAQQLDFVESELSGREWFAGDELSGADIQMSFPLEAAAARGAIGEPEYPRLRRPRSRQTGLPAGARARRSVRLCELTADLQARIRGSERQVSWPGRREPRPGLHGNNWARLIAPGIDQVITPMITP